jgi:hypothetical protein
MLAYRPGRRVQEGLAGLVLNPTRPEPVRAEAARQLRLHMQRFGLLMKPEQLASLVKLPAGIEDATLREEATRLAVGLQPDAATAGNRLKQFEPAPPGPEKPPVPAPEKPPAPENKNDK